MKASLLAIGGMSRSGKTTLAHQLAEGLTDKNLATTIIAQDDYCLPSSMLPRIHDIPDWEQPESMDWDRYHEQIFQLRQVHDWVILEGLFVMDDQKLKMQYDYTIFLNIDHATFLQRRNVEQRWGQEPDWYIQYVWDVYQKRNPSQPNGKTIHGDKDFPKDQIINQLLDLRQSH
jgi:nicotinamide/nicotinate riboside kinase